MNSTFVVTKTNDLKGTKLNGPSLADFIAASIDPKHRKLQTENVALTTISKLNIYIETYGCQMNVSDTEIVLSILNKAGHERCTDIALADVVITNTCAVRENAGCQLTLFHIRFLVVPN